MNVRVSAVGSGERHGGPAGSAERCLRHIRSGVLVAAVVGVLLHAAVASAAGKNYPQTFTGTASGSLDYAAQTCCASPLPVSQRFSAYTEQWTVTGLTFARQTTGMYRLTKGTAQLAGGSVVQTETDTELSTGDTCSYTLTTTRDATRPVTGSLTIFGSGTPGSSGVTVGFLIEIPVKVATQLDSGDCAFEGGLPPGYSSRFVIANSNAKLTPSGSYPITEQGVVSTVGNTIRTSLKLQGAGLEIVDVATRKDVTDASSHVVVGQQMELRVRLSDGSRLSSPKWLGISRPEAIRDYVVTSRSAHVIDLARSDLNSESVKFYWTKDQTYDVTVRARNDRTGKEETATSTFVVEAPEVNQFVGVTCGVGVNRTIRGNGFVPPEMNLGYNDTASGCHARPGIFWRVDITAPASSGGELGMTQLISDALTHNRKTCSLHGRPLTGGPPVELDNSPLYAYHSKVFTASQQGALDQPPLNDSPGIPLLGGGTWFRRFSVADYLVFKPDGRDSIWVTLRKLGPWSFSGTAKLVRGHWQMTRAANPPAQLSSAPSRQAEWSAVSVNGPSQGC